MSITVWNAQDKISLLTGTTAPVKHQASSLKQQVHNQNYNNYSRDKEAFGLHLAVRFVLTCIVPQLQWGFMWPGMNHAVARSQYCAVKHHSRIQSYNKKSFFGSNQCRFLTEIVDRMTHIHVAWKTNEWLNQQCITFKGVLQQFSIPLIPCHAINV